MHLLLVGLRGSGKTTIGRLIADVCLYPFVDLDDRTSALAGKGALECFEEDGEARWRELESIALASALAEEASIIALGGGTPTAPGAQEQIEDALAKGVAHVAWLDAPDPILLSRIGQDRERPALSELPPAEEMAKIRQLREPVFRQIAQDHIDTSALPVEEVVAMLAKRAQ